MQTAFAYDDPPVLPPKLKSLLAEMPEGARDCVVNRLKGVTADGYDDFLRNLLIAMGLEQMNAEFAPSEPLPPLPGRGELLGEDLDTTGMPLSSNIIDLRSSPTTGVSTGGESPSTASGGSTGSSSTVSFGGIGGTEASITGGATPVAGTYETTPGSGYDAEFEESKHPRAANGEFGSGGGGSDPIDPIMSAILDNKKRKRSHGWMTSGNYPNEKKTKEIGERGAKEIADLVAKYNAEQAAKKQAHDSFAMDRASVRTYDADNRLHVADTNISKANVCPYIGREIPDYEKLGLDPDKEYRLLRDPEELKKAARSFNNLPLLSRHVPVSAESHQPDLVIGSTGTDAAFDGPYLRNSLVIWARDAIDAVEGNTQKELSSAYRYRADMTPGTFNGEKYDGVMRDIVGNHVALVREGRAGPDVVVGDAKPQGLKHMARTAPSRKAALTEGALFAYLRPKLAQDAKLNFKPILANVTDANFKASKDVIVDRVKKATEGKLAQDADIGDLVQLLNGLEGSEAIDGLEAENPNIAIGPGESGSNIVSGATPEHTAATDPGEFNSRTSEGGPALTGGTDAGTEELKAFLLSKGMSEEDIAAALALLAPAAEAPVEEPPVDAPVDAPPEEPEAVDETAPPTGYIPREDAQAAAPGAQSSAGQGSTGKGGVGGQPHTILDLDRKESNDMVTKPAMDAAIAAAVKSATDAANRVQREIRDAERAVRPYVGDLAMAHDSAESVYRTALKSLGVKVEGVHASAFPVILSLQPKAGEKQGKPASSRVAMDSSSSKSFNEMFPDAARIRTM